VPSVSSAVGWLTAAPLATVVDVLLLSTVAHAASLHSSMVTVPLSVGSELVNVAFSVGGLLKRCAFAGSRAPVSPARRCRA
jgi:hypothetical protein